MNAFTSEEAEKAVNSGRKGSSIHPDRRFPGHSTRKAPRPSKSARLFAALSAHCERHPNDKQSANRLQRLPAPAALAQAA